jgi:CBS domain-containing protein
MSISPAAISSLLVSDYMSKNPVTVPSAVRLNEVIEIMATQQIGSVIVTREDMPAGVVTEREIIREVVKANGLPSDMTAEQVMIPTFVRVTPESSIDDAAQEMMAKKGRLLVFDDKILVGVLTSADLVRAFSKSTKNPPVSDAASMHLLTVAADETVASAAKLMFDKRVGSLLITEGGQITAIFTERDLVTRVLNAGASLNNRVGDFSSKPLIDLPLESSARNAAIKMAENKIKRLPLRSDDEIVGIVTARDLVELFTNTYD